MKAKLIILLVIFTMIMWTPVAQAKASELRFSEQDVKLLARCIYSEARGESFEGKLLVAQCVLDRLESGIWGNSLSKVIRAKNQFAKLGGINGECLEVARAAINGLRFREEASILYFRVTKSRRDWHAEYLGHVGTHAFYGEVISLDLAMHDLHNPYGRVCP